MASSDSKPSKGRAAYPSGWLAISRNESVATMIDAILDLPPNREFNQSELAEMSGVSRQSVSRHLGFLLDIEVIEPVEETSPQRFRFNSDSEVSQALIQLEGAMNHIASDLHSTE